MKNTFKISLSSQHIKEKFYSSVKTHPLPVCDHVTQAGGGKSIFTLMFSLLIFSPHPTCHFFNFFFFFFSNTFCTSPSLCSPLLPFRSCSRTFLRAPSLFPLSFLSLSSLSAQDHTSIFSSPGPTLPLPPEAHRIHRSLVSPGQSGVLIPSAA